MKFHESAVFVGLLVLFSDIGAAGAFRFDSAPHQDEHKNEDSIRYEPAWALTGHDEHRHLQDVCNTNIGGNGISPYNSTELTSRNVTSGGRIGTGSPGLGTDDGTCTKSGPSTSCQTTSNGSASANGGDRCVFPQCDSSGIAANTWHREFDNWDGHVTANAPAITDNGNGTYTYSFNISSSTVGNAISHGE